MSDSINTAVLEPTWPATETTCFFPGYCTMCAEFSMLWMLSQIVSEKPWGLKHHANATFNSFTKVR